jgi:hypothetical protein
MATGVQVKHLCRGRQETDKMIGQIHKSFHPDMGCSGSLPSTATVHLVNVGTSCLG